MYMKCINILWRAQTYRLGFLRRKERFVNRFLRILKGWFLAYAILCRNFVVEIRETGADGSAQAGGYESTGWKRIFDMVKQSLKWRIILEVGRRKEELGSGCLRRVKKFRRRKYFQHLTWELRKAHHFIHQPSYFKHQNPSSFTRLNRIIPEGE